MKPHFRARPHAGLLLGAATLFTLFLWSSERRDALARPKPSPTGTAAAQPSPAPSASASDAATPSAYSSLDGTWEVQVQNGSQTTYSHFKLRQSGQDVAGTWVVDRAHSNPLTGSYDGRLFKFTAAETAGPVTFSGYADGSSEMVGLLTRASGAAMPFTASHRGGLEPPPQPKRTR
jgi:hypothetical protein